ncbi:MAG: LexA repressor [Chlamydiae bacterium]|nr:LexA repressor [Chlamydiota bacterium]
MSLTDKEQEFFDYIKNFIEQHKSAPTYAELQSYFGFASKSSVYRHLQNLKNKGFIQINKKRGPSCISLIGPLNQSLNTYPLPLIGSLNDEGQIAMEDTEKTILCSSAKKISMNCYALKIKSGNFLEAGLLHNDMVIIEPRSEARVGEAILGLIYGERNVIKKYHPQGPYTRLDSFCVQIEPMIIAPEELAIQGILLGVIRTY